LLHAVSNIAVSSGDSVVIQRSVSSTNAYPTKLISVPVSKREREQRSKRERESLFGSARSVGWFVEGVVGWFIVAGVVGFFVGL
jgi:hypothetical protein